MEFQEKMVMRFSGWDSKPQYFNPQPVALTIGPQNSSGNNGLKYEDMKKKE